MKEIPRVVNIEQEVKEAGWTPPDVQEQPGLEVQEAPESPRDYAANTGNDFGPQEETSWEYVASDNASSAEPAEYLPFEIHVTSDSIIAAAGTLDGDAIAETTESSPANGTWYLEAKVTINASTGVVTATAVQWTATTPSTSTTTDFYQVIGEVDVVSGEPDPTSILNYDYGPLIVVQFGDVSDKWGVLIF